MASIVVVGLERKASVRKADGPAIPTRIAMRRRTVTSAKGRVPPTPTAHPKERVGAVATSVRRTKTANRIKRADATRLGVHAMRPTNVPNTGIARRRRTDVRTLEKPARQVGVRGHPKTGSFAQMTGSARRRKLGDVPSAKRQRVGAGQMTNVRRRKPVRPVSYASATEIALQLRSVRVGIRRPHVEPIRIVRERSRTTPMSTRVRFPKIDVQAHRTTAISITKSACLQLATHVRRSITRAVPLTTTAAFGNEIFVRPPLSVTYVRKAQPCLMR